SVLLHTRELSRQKTALERRVALAESISGLQTELADAQAPPSPAPATTAPVAGPSPLTPDAGQPQATSPPIPNHRMLRPIGRGSYGEVWLAQDDIGTHHAVKVVYRRNFATAAPYEREFRGIQKFTP